MRTRRMIAAIGAVVTMLTAVLSGSAVADRPQPQPLSLTHHAIKDGEGYGHEIEAIALLLPKDWQVSSRIAWNKPCSGNELYEVILRAQSPDGRYGYQILPTHKVEYLNSILMPGSLPPDMLAMAEAEQQQIQQQVIQAYAGSNCHFTEPHGALEVVRRYILPDRPPGARIINTTPLPEIRQALIDMQNQGMVPIPETQITVGADAITARLAYEAGGQAYEEDVSVAISGYTFRSEWPALGRIDINSTGFTLPIEAVWAPAGELDAMTPLVSAIKASARTNPRWLAAVNKTRAEIARIRAEGAAARAQIWAQTAQEISEMQMESWQYRQESQAEGHQQFIEYIRDVQAVIDPTSGHEVEMPAYYDGYYTNGQGDYVAVPSGASVNDLYPGYVWQEMQPVR